MGPTCRHAKKISCVSTLSVQKSHIGPTVRSNEVRARNRSWWLGSSVAEPKNKLRRGDD